MYSIDQFNMLFQLIFIGLLGTQQMICNLMSGSVSE